MKRVALVLFIIVISAVVFAQQRVGPTQVVASVQVYDQVGSIPETLLYTPKQEGVYQISVYSSVTVSSEFTCHEVIQTYLTYSNEVGSTQQTADLSLAISGLPGWRQAKFVIRAKTGSIISYHIDHVGDPCDVPGHYAFFVSLASEKYER